MSVGDSLSVQFVAIWGDCWTSDFAILRLGDSASHYREDEDGARGRGGVICSEAFGTLYQGSC